MNKGYLRLGLVVLGLGLGFIAWNGWWRATSSAPDALVGEPLCAPQPDADSVALPSAASGGSRRLPPDALEAGSGAASDSVAGTEPDPEPDLALDPELGPWELVDELRTLARDPESFHARALPLVDRLSELCSAGQDPPPDQVVGSASLAELLSSGVVQAEQEPALVRGAVYLAIAPSLSGPAFREIFDAWFLGSPDIPLELLRTAALAATRRGEPTACDHPLSLAKLARTQLSGSTPGVPRFFALTVDAMAPEYECGTLRGWLTAPDPRQTLLQPSPTPPADDDADDDAVRADRVAAADYFVTAELLFVVWGHGALHDRYVEKLVVDTALPSSIDFEPGIGPDRSSALHLRAAHFLVHSLSACNTGFAEAALRIASSDDPILAGVGGMMRRLVAGGSAAQQIARLESRRYATGPMARTAMIAELFEVQDQLAEVRGSSSPDRELTILYLDDLVQDVSLSREVRSVALSVVAGQGSWSMLKSSAEKVLRNDSDPAMLALAVGGLVRAAKQSPERSAEAVQLLAEFQAVPELEQSIASYLEQLQ